MSNSILVPLLMAHTLAAIIWIGGMFFAYMALRPAASLLEPPQRLTLWDAAFAKFFPWVWLSILTLFITGGGLMTNIKAPFVSVMIILGCIMAAIFVYLYFSPYKKLSSAVEAQNFPAAGEQLAKIRTMVGINLIIGLILAAVATTGRYWLMT
jgi:uncharacterized membrane protein